MSTSNIPIGPKVGFLIIPSRRNLVTAPNIAASEDRFYL